MTGEMLLLLVSIVIFVISTYVRRISKRAKNMSNSPGYSDTIDRASLNADIYTEHGMIDDDGSVRPQMKKSGSYYESLI